MTAQGGIWVVPPDDSKIREGADSEDRGRQEEPPGKSSSMKLMRGAVLLLKGAAREKCP